MLSDSHSYFSAALSGEGSTAAVLAGLPVALAGAICVTRKFRCATDVTTPPPPARRRHSPAGEASARLCQIRSPRGFGSSCVLCRSIGPPPRSLARGGRIRIRSARLQKARHVCLFACLEFRVPNSAGCRTGSNSLTHYTYVFHALPQSVPHYIGSHTIFRSLRPPGPVSAACAPRGTTHRAYRLGRRSGSLRVAAVVPPRPRRRPPRPSGAGPRAPPEPRGVACSCQLVRAGQGAGARESGRP